MRTETALHRSAGIVPTLWPCRARKWLGIRRVGVSWAAVPEGTRLTKMLR
jgi:hypothetical protein